MKVVCESVSRTPLNFSLVHPRPTGRKILMENKGKFVSRNAQIYLGVSYFVKKKEKYNKFVQFLMTPCSEKFARFDCRRYGQFYVDLNF